MEWFELKHRPQSRCGPKGSNERNVKLKRVVDFGAPRAAGRTILTHTGVGRTILTETQGAEFTMVRPALGKTSDTNFMLFLRGERRLRTKRNAAGKCCEPELGKRNEHTIVRKHSSPWEGRRFGSSTVLGCSVSGFCTVFTPTNCASECFNETVI